MAFIITDPCIGTKDSACVDVCPVDCIHQRKDEPEFEASTMLFIHPEECIDCGACVPACPVTAIYDSPDATPANQKDLVEIPDNIKAKLDIRPVKWIDEVLEIALERSPQVTTTTAVPKPAPVVEAPKESERRVSRRPIKPSQPH